MTQLSLCLPYYKNQAMLLEQFRTWSGYPEDLKRHLEILLVDDGSPAEVSAMSVPRPEGMPALRLYRVLVDLPWHQHGCRNLAAREAVSPWLLLTDMDHVLPAGSLRDLFTVLPSAGRTDVFTFNRLDAPKLAPTRDAQGNIKPHVNTFAIRKDHFWSIGGYDEDCVGYGTDGYFRNRMNPVSNRRHLAGISVIRYPREVIADASSSQSGVDPRAFRNAGRRSAETQRRLAEKRLTGEGPKILAFPWERVL